MRWARIALVLLVVELVVLAVTGAALFFWYRPSTASTVLGSDGVSSVGVLRGVHRIASIFAVWTTLATAVLSAIEPIARVSWRRWLSICLPMLLLVVVASGTGYLLPWDQFALWSISLDSDMNGYLPLFDDNVRFVLVGGSEVGKGTLLRVLFIHMLVGVAAIVLASATLRHVRR